MLPMEEEGQVEMNELMRTESGKKGTEKKPPNKSVFVIGTKFESMKET